MPYCMAGLQRLGCALVLFRWKVDMRSALFAACVVASGVMIATFGTVQAQEASPQDMDILKTFDRFVVAEIVGTRCGNFEEELIQKYQANFLLVMPAAMRHLEKMRPDMSKTQAQQVLDGRRKMLRDGIVQQLQEYGCEDESFKKLLPLFRVHAEWKPGEEAQ